MRAAAKLPGRPKTSPFTRGEQLRRAKQLQRVRERAAGLTEVQVKLPRDRARKLVVALRSPDFAKQLDGLIDEAVVDLTKHPVLAELAWNRAGGFVPARDAFGLYERNWRFVDVARMTPAEKRLLERLKQRFGAGLINA